MSHCGAIAFTIASFLILPASVELQTDRPLLSSSYDDMSDIVVRDFNLLIVGDFDGNLDVRGTELLEGFLLLANRMW